jgi:hypothetical protein
LLRAHAWTKIASVKTLWRKAVSAIVVVRAVAAGFRRPFDASKRTGASH